MSNQFHKVFGDINAENDDLLFACRINKINSQVKKPIITGRWGSGKTAQMLLQNEQQINKLDIISSDKKMVWYLSERDIVKSNITDLYEVYSSSIHRFESVLQSMWKAEIVRIYITLLGLFKDSYTNTTGDHWKHIFRIYNGKNFFETVSKHLSDIASVMLNRENNALQQLQENIGELLNEKTYQNLRKCLKDIYIADEFIPEIVIEPIETPHSQFEKNRSLAASVVRSLVEVYLSSFYGTVENPFKVRLVIPWHRLTSEVSFPQKLTDSKGFVSWTKSELYEFISKRIEWEFKDKNRKLSSRYRKGAWYELFDDKVKNGWIQSSVEEDSFDYFLRHTHYRTRDLINLCKVCVEELYDTKNEYDNESDVIKHGYIDKNTIKSAFHKYNLKAAEELINEAVRKFKYIQEIVDNLYRLPLVFSYEDISGRLQNSDDSYTTDEAIIDLWECGIIGVTAIPDNKEIDNNISIFCTEGGKKVFDSNIRWTWFFYNSNKTPIELMRILESLKCTQFGFVLHPKLYETFTPIISQQILTVPIGI